MTATAGGPGDAGGRTILFGGSGFLGHHILENYPAMVSVGRSAPRTGNRHVHVDSLSNLDALRNVEFSNVIYIIGNTDHSKLEQPVLDPAEPNAFDYHVTPFVRVMEQLRHYDVRKLIHFSSILLYDTDRFTLPVSEDAPISPYKSRYLLSKFMAEEACRFYSAWVPVINVRLSNIYGPSRLRRTDLVHMLIRQLLEQGAGSVWTTRPERDFIYIEDAAHAVVKLLDTDFTGTVNLGSGTATPIGEVVRLLRDISGRAIEDQERHVSGPMRFQCDITRLKSLIEWNPEWNLEAGLRRTYELMAEWARN